MGVSLLYHLTKEGWNDIVLIEKGELTSGSTWHAAGQCPHFVGSYNAAKIHNYSNKLQKMSQNLSRNLSETPSNIPPKNYPDSY